MTLPFTPTRPLPIDEESIVRISFPIVGEQKACGPVAVITFSSPDNLNAVTFNDLQAFFTLLEWLDEQDAVQITVLTGQGRFFSAGANFADPARATVPEELTKYDEHHAKHISAKRTWTQARTVSTNGATVRAMTKHSTLLVAALNGPAVGIMAAIVALCDLIYAYDDFYLLTPFSQLALVAEAGSSVSFVRKMGLGRAQQALIEGRKMPAKELLEAGFISRIFPTPANQEKSNKQYTRPILQDVLSHIGDRLLPPHVDAFAINYTKRLLRETAYTNKTIVEANADELQGADIVFRAGRPQKQFARLASGGRHKL
jgi:peroxisomal 3,2-trans-enoyl-CoA isomerase